MMDNPANTHVRAAIKELARAICLGTSVEEAEEMAEALEDLGAKLNRKHPTEARLVDALATALYVQSSLAYADNIMNRS